MSRPWAVAFGLDPCCAVSVCDLDGATIRGPRRTGVRGADRPDWQRCTPWSSVAAPWRPVPQSPAQGNGARAWRVLRGPPEGACTTSSSDQRTTCSAPAPSTKRKLLTLLKRAPAVAAGPRRALRPGAEFREFRICRDESRACVRVFASRRAQQLVEGLRRLDQKGGGEDRSAAPFLSVQPSVIL